MSTRRRRNATYGVASYCEPTLSVLEARAKREAQLCVRELKFVANTVVVMCEHHTHVTYLHCWEPKLNMRFGSLSACDKEAGHETRRFWAILMGVPDLIGKWEASL